MMTRFLHLWPASSLLNSDDSPAAKIRGYLAEQTPCGAILAEVPGYGDTNLNFHPPVLEYVIAANGETMSHSDCRKVLSMADLYIEHVTSSDRLLLRSRNMSEHICPVFQGGMTPTLLPNIQKLLLLFGPSVSAQLPTWQSVAPSLSLSVPEMREYPRVVCGDLTLLRRTWQINGQYLPTREKSEQDGAFYLRFLRWRSTSTLPERFYATFAPEAREQSDSHKPVYFDLSSLRSLLAFYKSIDGRQMTIWMTEAHPDPSEFSEDSSGHSHMCEFVFDLTTQVSNV
jgi:hypothetical protein